MDRFVVRQNIAHFRRLLKTETDEARRQVLLQLLAEHEAEWHDSNLPQENSE